MGVETLLKGSSSSELATQLKAIAKTDGVDVGEKAETFSRALQSAKRILDGKSEPKSKKNKEKVSPEKAQAKAENAAKEGSEKAVVAQEKGAKKTAKAALGSAVKAPITKADVEKAENQAVAAKPTRAHIVAESVKATLERLAAQKTTAKGQKSDSSEKKIEKSTSKQSETAAKAERAVAETKLEMPSNVESAGKKPKAAVDVSTKPVEGTKGKLAESALKTKPTTEDTQRDKTNLVKDGSREAVKISSKPVATADAKHLDKPVESVAAFKEDASAKTLDKADGREAASRNASRLVAEAQETDSKPVEEKKVKSEPKVQAVAAEAAVKKPKAKDSSEPSGNAKDDHSLEPQSEIVASSVTPKQSDPAGRLEASSEDKVKLSESESVDEDQMAPMAEPVKVKEISDGTSLPSSIAAEDEVDTALNSGLDSTDVEHAVASSGPVAVAAQETSKAVSSVLASKGREGRSEMKQASQASAGQAVVPTSDNELEAVSVDKAPKDSMVNESKQADVVRPVQIKQAKHVAQGDSRGPERDVSKSSEAKPNVTTEAAAETKASQHLAKAVGRQSVAKTVAVAIEASNVKKGAIQTVKDAHIASADESKTRPVGPKVSAAVSTKVDPAAAKVGGESQSQPLAPSKPVKVRAHKAETAPKQVVSRIEAKLVDTDVKVGTSVSVKREDSGATSEPQRRRTQETAPDKAPVRVRMGDVKDKLEFRGSALADRIAQRRETRGQASSYSNMLEARPKAERLTEALSAKLANLKEASKGGAQLSATQPKLEGIAKPVENTVAFTRPVATETAVASAKSQVSAEPSRANVEGMTQDNADAPEATKLETNDSGRRNSSQGDARRENESRHQEVKSQILREIQATDEASEELEEALNTEMAEELVQAKQVSSAVKASGRDTGRTGITALRDASDTARNQDAVSERRELHERILAKNLGRNLGRIASMGTTHARLQLHPQELGRVDVEIRTKDGEVTLLVRTETVQAAAELNSQMNDLRGSMREHGLELKDCDVDARGFGAEDRDSSDERDGSGSKGRGDENREGREKRRRRGRGQRIKRSAIDVVV